MEDRQYLRLAAVALAQVVEGEHVCVDVAHDQEEIAWVSAYSIHLTGIHACVFLCASAHAHMLTRDGLIGRQANARKSALVRGIMAQCDGNGDT